MNRTTIATSSVFLLCASMALALGGGLYEHLVLMPLWSASPPASFAAVQPDTGVPLQSFWIPVHAAISVFLLASLVLTWREAGVRRLFLVGLAAYAVMRVWSGAYFIPEMLAFQEVPTDAAATAELLDRVERWTSLSWLRTPLDVAAFACFLLGLHRLGGVRRAVRL